MSIWNAGAVVGSAVIGGVMAKKAGDKASDAQDRATAASTAGGEAEMDLAYEKWDEDLARYDEWRQIYGPIEENLGDFYNSLTPETFAAAGLEANQKEFQQSFTQMHEQLSQSGMWNSGIAAAAGISTSVAQAEKKAGIRRDAPFQVAEAKGQFLNQGKGGPTYAPSGTVSETMSNVNANNANMAQNTANLESSNASQLWGAAGSLLSTGLNYGAKNAQPTANQGAAKPDVPFHIARPE